jgi:hypothetical protein
MLQNPDFKFVWAEMSYLSKWWEAQNERQRKKLVE